jgi:excinuclease ABC subunit C
MAEKNALQIFRDRDARIESWQSMAANICRTLKLRLPPDRVICVDISNTGGKQSVGAVISFLQGEKESVLYRRYKIQTVEGPDDYASMREVLLRHLPRALEGRFLPDLIVVDGGKGQLGQAISVLQELKLADKIELVGIAKEKDDEGEKLYRPGRKNPLILARHSSVLLYLMKLRDEAHRYGITFHRKLRRKEAMTSVLDTIPGVGPMRKKALLTQLGSLEKIKKASVSQLHQVDGIPAALADKIHTFLRTCKRE